jgi:uncharacterized protein (DUF58 family)
MYFILLLGLGAAWLLQALLLHLLWQRKLSVTLRFQDSYIYEGEQSRLQEVIANDKWLPLPALEVRISFGSNLRFIGESAENSGVSDTTYKRDVFSILFHQQVTRSLSFVARKRGRYEIKEADLRAYDFFFHAIDYLSVPQNTFVYVYPAQVDPRRLDILCTALSGEMLVQNHLFPDPFEFSGIRAYQPTDPMNRINWKATLRMGEPMVNQFDSTTNLDLTLVFDVEDSHILKAESLVEETIRIVSSLAARLVASSMPLTIRSNAPDLSCLFLPANGSHMNELNQRLACIDGCAASGAELLTKTELPNNGGQVLVLISKNTDPQLLAAVTQCAATCPVLWVLPVYAHQTQSLPELPGVRIFRWEVI